jgi:hypothetical protein
MKRIMTGPWTLSGAIAITLLQWTPSQARAEVCNACTEYSKLSVGGNGSNNKKDNALSWAGVIQKCGQPKGQTSSATKPTQGSMFAGAQGSAGGQPSSVTTINQGIDTHFRSNPDDKNDPWDKCFADLQAQWAVLGQYCETLDYADEALTANNISKWIYTAAAVVCSIDCIAHLEADATSFGTSEAWLKGLDIACWVGVVGADASVISDRVMIGKANDRLNDLPEGTTNNSGEMAGIIANASAGASTLAEIAYVAQLAGSNVQAARVTSCLGAVLMDVAAIAKWKSIGPLEDVSAKNCASARKMVASPMAVPSGSPSLAENIEAVDTLRQALTSGGVDGNASGGSSSGGAGGSFSPREKDALRNPLSPKFSAATAGRMDRLLRTMDPDAFKKALELAGTSMADIAKRLRNQSPSQVVAALGGNQAGLGAALANVEKAVESGKLPLLGANSGGSMIAGRGGRGGGTAKSGNPFGMFGMRGPDMGGAPTQTTFEKTKRALANEVEGDIWHEGFGGTIFQIVSGKLDKTRDRIDQLEWETPLNRALVGLPAKKKR